jgi:hypothetical protein
MAHSYGAMDVLNLLFYGDNSAFLWNLSCEKAIRKNAISLHRGGAECELKNRECTLTIKGARGRSAYIVQTPSPPNGSQVAAERQRHLMAFSDLLPLMRWRISYRSPVFRDYHLASCEKNMSS